MGRIKAAQPHLDKTNQDPTTVKCQPNYSKQRKEKVHLERPVQCAASTTQASLKSTNTSCLANWVVEPTGLSTSAKTFTNNLQSRLSIEASWKTSMASKRKRWPSSNHSSITTLSNCTRLSMTQRVSVSIWSWIICQEEHWQQSLVRHRTVWKSNRLEATSASLCLHFTTVMKCRRLPTETSSRRTWCLISMAN